MTIHHDKQAYGRIKPVNEELSDAEIADMLKKLNEKSDEVDKSNENKDAKKSGDKKLGANKKG